MTVICRIKQLYLSPDHNNDEKKKSPLTYLLENFQADSGCINCLLSHYLFSLSLWCIFNVSLSCFLSNVFKDNNSSWEHFQSGEWGWIIIVPVSCFLKGLFLVVKCTSKSP